MSVRVARSRLAGEPADVLISPRLAQLGLMDYHRGAEAIADREQRALVLLDARGRVGRPRRAVSDLACLPRAAGGAVEGMSEAGIRKSRDSGLEIGDSVEHIS